jgi:hypothetical protein
VPPLNKIKLTSFVSGALVKLMELNRLDDNIVLMKL